MKAPVIIPKDVCQANFDAWLATSRELLGVNTETTKPNAQLDIRKIEQLVILTFFRNLGLTDMRYSDMDIIRKICRTYLNDTNDIKGSVAFKLDSQDSLELRLNYLATHMTCMINTFKPLATPFNTGHVRIMDMNVAADLMQGKNENCCIVRTSSSNPATLTVTSLVKPGHYRLEGDKTFTPDRDQTAHTIKGMSITMSNGKVNKFSACNMFNYRKQGYLLSNAAPELVLAPFSQLLQAERELKAEFKRDEGMIHNGYYVPLDLSNSQEIPIPPASHQPAANSQNNNNEPAATVSRNPSTAFFHREPTTAQRNDLPNTHKSEKKM